MVSALHQGGKALNNGRCRFSKGGLFSGRTKARVSYINRSDGCMDNTEYREEGMWKGRRKTIEMKYILYPLYTNIFHSRLRVLEGKTNPGSIQNIVFSFHFPLVLSKTTFVSRAACSILPLLISNTAEGEEK